MHAKDLAVWVSNWSMPLTPLTWEAAAFAETGGEYQNYPDKEATPQATSEGRVSGRDRGKAGSTQRLGSQEARDGPELWGSRSGAQSGAQDPQSQGHRV